MGKVNLHRNRVEPFAALLYFLVSYKKDLIRRQCKGHCICLGGKILAVLAVLPQSIYNKQLNSTGLFGRKG